MAVTNSGMTLYTDNDTQQNWTGTNDLDIEVFIQGVGAESWLVGKNSTETGTLTLSAAMGTPKYFTCWMKSDWANYYTDITMELESTTNNFESFIVATAALPDISGDFKPALMQIGQGTSTGTYVPNSHTVMRVIVDASASGNIRAIVNHWIDAMYYGSGRTIAGTTATDKVFTESDALDKSSDTYDGLSEIIGGVVFLQSDVTLNTTTGNSFAETVVFKSSRNTDDIYTLDITGTASFQGTALAGSGGATVHLDASGATAFSMLGGSLNASGTTLFASGQNIKGIVFTGRTSITQSACNFEDNTVNTSGVVTVTTGGTCTNNTFNSPTGISAVNTADLSLVPDNSYVSDGSSHAVEVTTIGTGAMTWDSITSGFDSGATGSPVTPTTTGNEDIYVSATTGTLTINVATGATIPSIRSGGATINVVAGQVTTLITVKHINTGAILEGARVYLVAGAGGPLTEGTVIFNTLTDVNGQVSDTRSLASAQPVLGRVRFNTSPNFYKTVPINETISNISGLTLNVSMIPDS